jgi:hypothetical protein
MSNVEITEQYLLNSGYKKYPKPLYSHDGADSFYQKRFDNDLGKMFYINVWTYSFPQDGVLHRSASFEVQYTLQDDEYMDVNYHYTKDKTIKQIELFFLRMFASNDNIRHYELWEN